MSFIAKNPLTIPEIPSSPSLPDDGTRGLYARSDGWYDVDSDGNIKKLLTEGDASGNVDLSGYYNKDETEQLVDNKISSVYKYCGSVDDLDNLPIYNWGENIGYTYNILNNQSKSFSRNIEWTVKYTYKNNIYYGKFYDNEGNDITSYLQSGAQLFFTTTGSIIILNSLSEFGWIVNTMDYLDASLNLYQFDCSCNAGDNIAWTGYCWDNLGGTVDLSNYYTKTQIDSKIANEFYEYEGSVNVRFNDVNGGKQDKDKMITFNPFGILPEDITDWYPSVPSMMYYVESYVGNIEEATAAIIALQNSYIGGETV